MSSKDPIIIHTYSENWPQLAADEIQRIRHIPFLAEKIIEHIGSTSVPGLSAKPVIDLVIEVSDIEDAKNAITPLEAIGYSYWRANPDEKHLYFVKGLPPIGAGRTHHVHFFEADRFNEHVLFRDILRKNAALAEEYQTLKTKLAKQFKHDREAYTDAKTDFIQRAIKVKS
jgi:GrpB-like predicted nucleotidyltransferase (UPF0157 family)